MSTEVEKKSTSGPGASPARNIRISDDLWERACRKAREEDGESISAIVRSFLREYVRD